MCYICLNDNPFDAADAFVRKHTAWASHLSEVQARAIFLKALVRAVEANDESRCDVGEGTLVRLKEEQRRVAREL